MVILISFFVKPVLFVWFLADAQLTKIPTPTKCKEFCHMALLTICKLERQSDRRWRLIRCHLLAISVSKQVE